jgi:hypothetical protein
MKRIKFACLVAAFIALGLTGEIQAQARTWALSKDTVYEWSAYGDSVRMTNSGSDTLKIDSIGLQLVRPAGTRISLRFRDGGGGYHTYSYNQGVVSVPYGPTSLKLHPTQSDKYWGFDLDSIIYPPLAKRSFNHGDTLVLRAIFVGKSGRGNDTLIVMGRAGYTTALLPASRYLSKPYALDDRLFDLRGRRVEKVPEGRTVPWAPVVSPKD